MAAVIYEMLAGRPPHAARSLVDLVASHGRPIPALAGVVFALFMVYVPTIIDSIMTATI